MWFSSVAVKECGLYPSEKTLMYFPLFSFIQWPYKYFQGEGLTRLLPPLEGANLRRLSIATSPAKCPLSETHLFPLCAWAQSCSPLVVTFWCPWLALCSAMSVSAQAKITHDWILGVMMMQLKCLATIVVISTSVCVPDRLYVLCNSTRHVLALHWECSY